VNSKTVNVVVTLVVRGVVWLVEAANDVVEAATKQRRGAERSRQLMCSQITCGSQPPHHCHPRLDRSAPSFDPECREALLSSTYGDGPPWRDIHRHGSSQYGARSGSNGGLLGEYAPVPRGFDFEVKVV
jgi:hypothetical protein